MGGKEKMQFSGSYLLQITAIVLCFAIQTGGSNANSQINRYANFTNDERQSFISRYISPRALLEDLNEPEYQESCQKLLYQMDDLDNKMSLSEVNRRGTEVLAYITFYSNMQIQRFDSFLEMKQSGGPQVDNELCLRQLADLKERLDVMAGEKYDSKDVNLAQLLDTYGKEPAGRFLGDEFWPGAYEECLRLKIKTPDNDQTPTRYCVANLRDKRWPNRSNPVSLMIAMKSGICLPRSCDSIRYKNKYDLIFDLIQANIRDIEKDETYLSDLYCLPDSKSPFRTWWKQPKSLITFLSFMSWILLVIVATFRYNSKNEQRGNKFLRTLSITNNLRLLFDVNKKSSLLEAEDGVKSEENGPATEAQVDVQQVKRGPVVDLRCLEAIKVIAMFYVIVGHLMMFMIEIITNGRDMVLYFLPTFLIANQAGIFIVNTFFTITGILTSYLLFKDNRLATFKGNQIKWLAFILYRYMRIMPMYVLAVAYTKYLAKYIGSGPFWDYGTSSLGFRRICEQESWLWVLSFGANFKIPISHCQPAAWYLANDFQFFLVTPIYLGILYSKPRLGKWLIYVSIFAGYLTNALSTYTSSLEDMRPVAQFQPNSLKAYLMNMFASYTEPQNRINVYLFGLLLGYYLHLHEKEKLEFRAKQTGKCGDKIFTINKTANLEPDWPPVIKNFGLMFSAVIMLTISAITLISTNLHFDKFWSRILVSFAIPSSHLSFSLAIGLLILLVATGNGNRLLHSFLSSSFWKPLARLSLSVLLTHMEVVYTLITLKTRKMFTTTFSHLELIIISTIVCYLVAIVVCVLFEAPIRATLGHIFTFALSKTAKKKPAKKSTTPVQV